MLRIMCALTLCAALAAPATAETSRKEFGEWSVLCRGTIGPSNCAVMQEQVFPVSRKVWARMYIDFDASGKPRAMISVPPSVRGQYIFFRMSGAGSTYAEKVCHPDRCETPPLNARWVEKLVHSKNLQVEYLGEGNAQFGLPFSTWGLERAIEYVLGEKA